jgi:hypothetical protein
MPIPSRSNGPRTRTGLTPSPPKADGSASQGVPVNPLSRAVHPRDQYPLHFDLLMRDIFACGIPPEEWQVIAAEEVRLDEEAMDVEFTLLRTSSNQIRRRRVEVRQGYLLRIIDC